MEIDTPALDQATLELLRAKLPEVATHTIAAVVQEVPEYREGFQGGMRAAIEQMVQIALAGFLRVAAKPRLADPGMPQSPALEGAYALGRGEARMGRSADALLAAYRVGARVSWRELAATAVEGGVPADVVASFAELVFAYIDELSAASVAGHTDETETTGRVRQLYLDRLAQRLLRGNAPEVVAEAATRADWPAPETLTAVVLPDAHVRGLLTALDGTPLQPPEHEAGADLVVLLVPEVPGGRAGLLRALAGRHAVVGQSVAWTDVRASYLRAMRAMPLKDLSDPEPLDTDTHLATLVVTADPTAREDLRARALAPLAGVRDASAEKLEETLRMWLLLQGRRDAVAAALFVHPQTVRYRMSQIRDLWGDSLDDPEVVRDLVLALA